MTRDEAVALVKQGLGFKTAMDSAIITTMKACQTNLELGPTKPWFLLSEDATYTTVAGERRIPLPPDFLEEYEEGAIYYAPTDGDEIPLTKDISEQLRSVYASTSSGTPEAYALVGNYFQLYPTPDDAYLLRMKYYQRATILNSNLENEWLKWAPNILIGQAGSQIAAGIRDWKAKETFDSMAQGALLLLQNQNEARKHANLDMQIGGPH